MSKEFRARTIIRESLLAGSSRSVSRARTPLPDSEENGALDVNFLSIEELLSSRLDSLQALLLQSETEETENRDSMIANSQDFRQASAQLMNKSRIQSNSTTVNDVVASLQHSRANVSSQSRELLLAQLYKLIVTKSIVAHNEQAAGARDYVSEETALDLVKLLSVGDYRSPSEFILLYRSVIAILASDLEDFGEIVSTGFLDSLEALILAPPNSNINNENKASLVTGYCGLLLVLYGDASAFGVDDKVRWLLEYAQGFVQSSINSRISLDTGDREYSTYLHESDDKRLVHEQETQFRAEANIAVAALHGIGLLLTLLLKGEYLNELLTDITTALVEVIDNDVIVEISKAAAKVVALCYELFTYELLEEDDDGEEPDTEFNYNAPYYEQGVLLNICERLSNLSTRKIGKKEKKDTNSVFSELSNTITHYTNPVLREEIYKLSPGGLELLSQTISTTSVKLSRSKALAINSWYLYFRLLHLKWVFGFGLHDQLMSNTELRALLRPPPSKYQESYSSGGHADADDFGYGRNAQTDVERFARTDKKRANDLKKAREEKVTQKMEDLQILS